MPKKCELEDVSKSLCFTNGYDYIGYIDAGAFKETYLIQYLNEKYALKIFKTNNTSERTQREIDAMKRTSCMNIAQLIKVDYYLYNGISFLYLIEEYLAGGSLGSLMKASTLTKDETVSIGNNLLNALDATYSAHIVHRDIKPDNIMFRGSRTQAVLVDFGLVRDLDASSLTQDFHIRGPGTALYSAPEQLNNNKPLIDWRTDQFALGITLCEAITGKHPFDTGNPAKTVEKIASMECCNNSIARELTDLGLFPIIKMIEPYPINRYRIPQQLNNDWKSLE